MCIENPFRGRPFNLFNLKAGSRQKNECTCLQFESLSGQKRLIHGVFTRHGGVSKSPYNSLNVSYATGDKPESVEANLKVIKECIGARELLSLNQVHGRKILPLRRNDSPDLGSTTDADGFVTDITGVALMIKLADCQGVILFDPTMNVIANVHCGWKGNVCNILGAAVDKMRSDFGCKAPDIVAGITPSLGPCCAEFTTYQKIFPGEFKPFMKRENYFDLWTISRMQLMEAGLAEEKIELAGICTKCNTDLFFSYRGEGDTGRFASIAMLR